MDGRPAGLPARGADGHDGRRARRKRVAVLIHDLAPRRARAGRGACSAAGIAVDNERLHADLRTRLEELRRSRLRVIEAADAERRRLERNLHDGAQQGLATLAVELAMLAERLESDPEARRLLEQAQDGLAESLEELRELARGIHPAVLTDHGLALALDALAERTPFAVRLAVEPGDGAGTDRGRRLLRDQRVPGEHRKVRPGIGSDGRGVARE